MGHTVDRCITMLEDANEPKVFYIGTIAEMMSVASISVYIIALNI